MSAHHSLKCEIGSLAVKVVATELSLLALKEFFIFLLAELWLLSSLRNDEIG